jgi:hypothetical protein
MDTEKMKTEKKVELSSEQSLSEGAMAMAPHEAKS